MEYRKKHLKPKKALAQDMSNILINEIHMDQIDFFQQLRKQGFASQIQHGIKCQKNCHLTANGLERFLNESLVHYLQLQLRKTQSMTLQGQIKKHIETLQNMNLGGEHIKERVIQELSAKFTQDQENPTEQESVKIQKMSDQLNTKELQMFFNGRYLKMLDSVAQDRKKRLQPGGSDGTAMSKSQQKLHPTGGSTSDLEKMSSQSYISQQTMQSRRLLQSPGFVRTPASAFQGIEKLFSQPQLGKKSDGTIVERDVMSSKVLHHHRGTSSGATKETSNKDEETNSPMSRGDKPSNGGVSPFASHAHINSRVEQLHTRLDATPSLLQPTLCKYQSVEETKVGGGGDLTVSQVGSELGKWVTASLKPEEDPQFAFDDFSEQLLKKIGKQQNEESDSIATSSLVSRQSSYNEQQQLVDSSFSQQQRMIESQTTAGSMGLSQEKENQRNAHNKVLNISGDDKLETKSSNTRSNDQVIEDHHHLGEQSKPPPTIEIL